jgi:hypothetical protein
MRQTITGFHQDADGDWVAELSCGHNQHVRHNPPLWPRPWVLTPGGRAERIGTPLPCPPCDRGEVPEGAGDPACWAGLLCPECGAVLTGGDPHRAGCPVPGNVT